MSSFSRRRFLGSGVAAGTVLGLGWGSVTTFARAAPGPVLTKYIVPLPTPGNGIRVAQASGTGAYSFLQQEITVSVHPNLTPTPVWAYDDESGQPGQAGAFGVVVVAQSGTPITMQFTNLLPQSYPAWLPVDTRLTPVETGSAVRAMTHLHGGAVAAASDGNPVVNPLGFGRGDVQTVTYPNQASLTPATMLWAHDHGPGTTRLNVVAGLAMGYIVRDQYDDGQDGGPIGIPGGAYEVPLVIQDRSYNADGTLFYPTSLIPGVKWIGEYFGNVMLVNGKAWPYLNVEPRLYRFRILNGCNARILNLDIGGATFWVIGGDQGMFDIPVKLSQLVMAPGERLDVIVDFSKYAGTNILMTNQSPPKPVSTPAASLSNVMQFRVGTQVTNLGPTTIPTQLPGQRANIPASAVVRTRFITLNEVGVNTAGWYLNLNGKRFIDAVEENPKAGTVEDWVYVNLTADTHPMHVHLVRFQVVDRTPFDVKAYSAFYGTGPGGVTGGGDPSRFATGPAQPPAPEERGFKDTVKVNPAYYTRIRIKFDLPDSVKGKAPQSYVHHCHIVEHEDNDMMRPFTVIP